MNTDIVATPKLGGRRRGQREFVGVQAMLRVPVRVEVDLLEDGSYELRKVRGTEDKRVIHVSAGDVEAAIDERYDSDVLAGAYSDAMELDLDPDAAVAELDDVEDEDTNV